ncbi:marine proteobacterial sortase target protein [Shewanella cyperi]|uniref:Marine proteobacterial sortase target protein n=1 Tax=Shewanella cyperi TaxID=2814292 RepID=A0A975AMM1_9GAMM|nr:marine proteobacterial sortase target protein [Shewanella cyperi]QSX31458.1 marine proteobacterial sortase target protein [Shewanella cyperi]
MNSTRYQGLSRWVAAVTLICSAGAGATGNGADWQQEAGKAWVHTEAAEPGMGLLQYRDSQGQKRQLIAVNTRVQMHVSGWLNRVVLEQEFLNLTGETIQGQYQFPLPQGAAVDGMELDLGQRKIVGEIQEKQAARARFEQAKQQGQRAALLEHRSANLFHTEVANLMPGALLKVRVNYLQTLNWEQQGFELRFPMTLTPRYLSPLLPMAQGQVPMSASAMPRQARVSLELLLEGFDIRAVTSPYHQIQVEREAEDRTRVRLEDWAANRDFVLRWQPGLEQAPKASVQVQQGLSYGGEEQGYFHGLLSLLPPATELALAVPRELVLVIDTSGSMTGESLSQAKAALAEALNQLTPADSFNLIAFNSDVTMLWPQSRPWSAQNLKTAMKFVRSLEAEGGTEMAAALNAALPSNASGERVRQVIFITDGAVGQEQALFTQIEEQLGDSRLFTVGIGAAPNGFFMERAAQAGKGSFTYIGKAAEVSERMQALLERIAKPRLSHIRVQFEDGTIPEHWPAAIPDLYAETPLQLSFRLPAASHGDLMVSGRIGAKPWQVQLPLIPVASQRGLDLAFGQAQISALERARSAANGERTRQQITALGLKYHLMSPYTSLVAVDQEAVNQGQPGPLVQLATPLPAHWQGGMPQTALGSALWLLLGSVCLLLALVFECLGRLGRLRLASAP